MKKRISAFLCIWLAAGVLAGCGGEYAGTTDQGGVSGSAVSGSAVTDGVVSDSAVKGVESKEEREKNRTNWYCSETNFYYAMTGFISDKPFIMEWNKENGTKRKIECEDLSNLCYVDDNWVYYTVFGKWFDENDFHSEELYRAPIEQNRLNLEKAELLFTERLGISYNDIYCDGSYVAYIDEEMRYKKYDLKEKRFIGNFAKDKKEYETDILAVSGENIYLRLEGKGGLYSQKLDSAKTIKITDGYVLGSAFAATESDVYYSEEYALPFTLMKYHLEDGSKQAVLTEKQVDEFLKQMIVTEEEESYLRYEPNWMFVSGNRLYIQFEVQWDREKGLSYHKQVIAYLELEDNAELHYAKELTEYLERKDGAGHSEERETYEGSIDLSMGCCVDMTDEKCYMYCYDPKVNKTRLACYDFAKGDFSYPDKEDMDWYLPYYAAPFVSMEKFMSETYMYYEYDSDWDFIDFY